jgi:hypothetical protein
MAEEAAGEALAAALAGGSNPMLEIGQNREYPTVPLFGAVDAELRQDVRHMGLDRPLVDPESVPDPSVGPTLRHSASTSPSRGVSESRALLSARGLRSRATTSLSSAVPPAATRRNASRKSSTSSARSLSRYPNRPRAAIATECLVSMC